MEKMARGCRDAGWDGTAISKLVVRVGLLEKLRSELKPEMWEVVVWIVEGIAFQAEGTANVKAKIQFCLACVRWGRGRRLLRLRGVSGVLGKEMR